jgi:sugar lactone lactonase YvrE
VVGNGTAGYSGDGHSATGAELNSPNGLIFDSSGTLYIDDAGNKVVRKISF